MSLPSRALIPTVFHEGWWLEAATAGRYDQIEVRNGNGVAARMPYVVEHRFGHRVCAMPPMTHLLGPAIDSGTGSPANRSLRHFQLTQELLRGLDRFSAVYQKLHRGITDTLAFSDAGYHTTVEFTFELQPLPAAQLWRGMRDKARNAIRRAEERLQVTTLDDPERFAAFYTGNLQARGRRNAFSQIMPVCAAALKAGQGRMLGATDRAGQLAAAIFVVWDHVSCYYVLSTRAEDSPNGAVSLLVWHMIQDAAARGLVFDFEGVGDTGNRVFFTGFGGETSPRYIVSRRSVGLRLLDQLGRAAGRVACRAPVPARG